MKRQSNALLWLVLSATVLIFAGCSHSSSSTNQSQQNVTMQAGQWEIALVPSGGNAGSPVVIEANLSSSAPGSGMTMFSNESNTEIFQQSTQKGPCLNFFFSGTISGTFLSGTLTSPTSQNPATPLVSISNGAIASNGQAVSNGTYTTSGNTICVENVGSSGTFSANTVSPLNGTYAGTLSWTNGRTDQINIAISQDASFGITEDGTDNCSSPNTPSPCPAPNMTLHMSPRGPGFPDVIGALWAANLTATFSGGSQTLSFFAYFDATGQSLTVVPCCGLSGTLTKQ